MGLQMMMKIEGGKPRYIGEPYEFDGEDPVNSTVGAYTYIGKDTLVFAADIGRFCSIARRAVIGPSGHPENAISSHVFVFHPNGRRFKQDPLYQAMLGAKSSYKEPRGRTRIGNDVWIAANAFIQKGVTIGDGAIVGAGAVVTKNVEPYSVVIGVPAKHFRYRFDEKTRERLLRARWWDYHLPKEVFGNSDINDAVQVLDVIEPLIAAGKLERLDDALERTAGARATVARKLAARKIAIENEKLAAPAKEETAALRKEIFQVLHERDAKPDNRPLLTRLRSAIFKTA